MQLLSKTGRFLFWFFCLIVALVSLRIIVMGMAAGYPNMLHQFPREAALYSHVIGASFALLLMPFQIWATLRTKRPTVHRWIGRTYGVAVLIGGISGLILAPFAATGHIAAVGFFTLAIVWLFVTAVGVMAARAGDIKKHRAWMLRSMALTFAAVTLRLMLAPTIILGAPFEIAYPIIAWACWVPNFVIMEIFLRKQKKPTFVSIL